MTAGYAYRAADGVKTASSTELWVLVGQAALISSLWFGFEVTPFRDSLATVIDVFLVGVMILLSPSGAAGRIVLSWPVVCFFWWWMLSVVWANNQFGWELRTLETIPSVVVGIVVASMIPTTHVIRALVWFSTAMILYQVYPMVFSYASASVSTGLTGEYLAGWRGSFGHKNSMAPSIALGLLVVVLFARRGWRRWVTIAWGAVLVAMSLSVTGLALSMVIVSGIGWYRAYTTRRGRMSTAFLVASVALGTMVIGCTALLFPWFIGLYGKDVTLSGRTEIWAAVWKRVLDHPIVGHGMGGAWVNFGEEPTSGMVRDVGFYFSHAHNGLLEITFMLGIVGAALWLILLFSTLVLALRVQHVRPDIFQLLVLLPLVLIVLNVSEVAVYGPWLSMLVICRVLAIRARLDLASGGSGRGHRLVATGAV
jgi:O-antigen ligase